MMLWTVKELGSLSCVSTRALVNSDGHKTDDCGVLNLRGTLLGLRSL